jgi:hypothetical protein
MKITKAKLNQQRGVLWQMDLGRCLRDRVSRCIRVLPRHYNNLYLGRCVICCFISLVFFFLPGCRKERGSRRNGYTQRIPPCTHKSSFHQSGINPPSPAGRRSVRDLRSRNALIVLKNIAVEDCSFLTLAIKSNYI